jgi:hypothetical protein
MSEFIIGDEVRVVARGFPHTGHLGTITGFNQLFQVFETDCECGDRPGWYPSSIELVSSRPVAAFQELFI